MGLDEQAQRASQKCEQLHRARLEQLEQDHAANIARSREASATEATKFSETLAAKIESPE